jgi:hypothetical protein
MRSHTSSWIKRTTLDELLAVHFVDRLNGTLGAIAVEHFGRHTTETGM